MLSGTYESPNRIHQKVLVLSQNLASNTVVVVVFLALWTQILGPVCSPLMNEPERDRMGPGVHA